VTGFPGSTSTSTSTFYHQLRLDLVTTSFLALSHYLIVYKSVTPYLDSSQALRASDRKDVDIRSSTSTFPLPLSEKVASIETDSGSTSSSQNDVLDISSQSNRIASRIFHHPHPSPPDLYR
jgi:hypothetical protein